MSFSVTVDRRFSGVMFDLDGVLIDSTLAVEAHWQAFAEWYGFDAELIVSTSHGRTHRAVINQYLADGSQADRDQAIARFEQLEVDDAVAETAMPGALELLDSLNPDSFTMVTSCWWELAVARTKAAGINLPDNAVTADQVAHGKPAPDAYLLGAQRLGVAVEDCLVFEDSAPGITAGRSAGATVVALQTTTAEATVRAALAGTGYVVADLRSVSIVADANGLGLTLSDQTQDVEA